MPSYAALLREVDAQLDCEWLVEGPHPFKRDLLTLADLLERVTPEGVERLYRAVVVMSIAPSVPMDLMAAIRALAAGPQGEEGRSDA